MPNVPEREDYRIIHMYKPPKEINAKSRNALFVYISEKSESDFARFILKKILKDGYSIEVPSDKSKTPLISYKKKNPVTRRIF